MSTIELAIEQSIVQNEIVSAAEWPAAETELLAWCDDSEDADCVHEYWGRDDFGSDWRVHVEVV